MRPNRQFLLGVAVGAGVITLIFVLLNLRYKTVTTRIMTHGTYVETVQVIDRWTGERENKETTWNGVTLGGKK